MKDVIHIEAVGHQPAARPKGNASHKTPRGPWPRIRKVSRRYTRIDP